MGRKYSDDLPSFKKDRNVEVELKGQERFDSWIEDGEDLQYRPKARPMMRMVALLVIILCLTWSAANPGGVKRILVGPDHPRVVLPIGIVSGETPEWTEANIRTSISTVRPRAQKCLNGWSEMTTNDDGMVVVEVSLTPEGPEEAAIFDQLAEVPVPIQNCLGTAIGSVAWPLPTDNQSIPFPIVGGPE
ncbi:MAG: hypothetical protein CL930_01770 [Deltaproteobacteria bacterium]|nr:hypothetical protein [Deltaproteobacteria bacterium]|tara:strand:+ start:103 stop:669 length:567 start_codon:yes stop_codon:yes gene_type:complete